jgi:hypothetical protein
MTYMIQDFGKLLTKCIVRRYGTIPYRKNCPPNEAYWKVNMEEVSEYKLRKEAMANLTQELADLLVIYQEKHEMHQIRREDQMFYLVHYMKNFIKEYDAAKEYQEKIDTLRFKLGLSEEEDEDE